MLSNQGVKYIKTTNKSTKLKCYVVVVLGLAVTDKNPV